MRDRKLFSHIVDLDEYYEDLERGTLPAVAYIAPAGGSEHPPGGVATGPDAGEDAGQRARPQRGLAELGVHVDLRRMGRLVRPRAAAPRAAGSACPALLVSPYARRGVVDSTPLDHTSILRFIEDNWRLAPLAARDKQARSLDGAFDFAGEPREPQLIAGALSSAREGSPRRWLIYLLYGAAVMLAVGSIARVASGARAGSPRRAGGGLRARRGAAPCARRSGAAGDPDGSRGPGMRFVADGIHFEADSSGRAYPPAALVGSRARIRALDDQGRPGRASALRPLVPRRADRRARTSITE